MFSCFRPFSSLYFGGMSVSDLDDPATLLLVNFDVVIAQGHRLYITIWTFHIPLYWGMFSIIMVAVND